ncbi:MAG: GNAT family N-acetyltransferase [Haloarculaceae archaeon]
MTDELAFRPVGPGHHDEFRRVVDYAFEPAAGPQDHDDEFDRIADPFGLFDGDDLLSVCAHYGFDARLRGEWVPMAGLAAVATPPEHRRRGHVRRMVEASLERWRGEFPLAALWSFSRSYYEQFGWAMANTFTEYTFPTAALSVARERRTRRDPDGDWRVRRATADDWADLQTAHEAHAADRELTIRRDEEWWRQRVFRTLDGDHPYVYVCERDGELRGYVVYTFEKTGDGLDDRRLEVADLAFADHEARLALLALLADHDSQAVETVHYAGDTSLLDLLEDPSAADCTVHAGPMVRVVDVPEALETTPYPDDVTADLTLAVADDTAGWNDGTFRLRVADGGGTCERAAVAPAEADATVGVGTLSQLVAGYHSVDEAHRLGNLAVRDDRTAEGLAALFPPRFVYLRTYF